MICKSECKNRKLYRINSRNLKFGVYREETGGFLGLRYKFGNTYVFEEYHYDNGPPFGTVKPIEELEEELPNNIECLADFPGSYCETCKIDVEYKKWEDGLEHEVAYPNGDIIKYDARWVHLAETNCNKPMPVGKYNFALDKWLHEMQEKYRK